MVASGILSAIICLGLIAVVLYWAASSGCVIQIEPINLEDEPAWDPVLPVDITPVSTLNKGGMMIGSAVSCWGCGATGYSCCRPYWCSERCRRQHELKRQKHREALQVEIAKQVKLADERLWVGHGI